MARPRKDVPPDRFTSSEMAVAAGISARNFGLLQDRGFAPGAADGDRGRSGNRLWDSWGISQSAVIGAFHNQSGFELLLAAKLAALFAQEVGIGHVKFPSRLDDYLQSPLNPTPGKWPWEVDLSVESNEIYAKIEDDYWLHHLLRTRTKAYRPRNRMKGDFLLEIADQQYVFENAVRDLEGVKYLGGKEAEPLYRITAWERGSDAEVQSIVDEAGGPLGTPGPDKRLREIEAEFMAARRNAVSLLQVNISLAIRNAFDAIHEHRIRNASRSDPIPNTS